MEPKKSAWYSYNYDRRKRGEKNISYEEYSAMREKGPLTRKLYTEEEMKERNNKRFRDKYHNDNEFRERKLEISKASYQRRKEKVKEQHKQYRQNNKEKIREYDRKRRELLKSDPIKYAEYLQKARESVKRFKQNMSDEKKKQYNMKKDIRRKTKYADMSEEEKEVVRAKWRERNNRVKKEHPEKQYQWYVNWCKKRNRVPKITFEQYLKKHHND